MDQQSSSILPNAVELNVCIGCTKADEEVFSIDSEDDLSDKLLDQYFDKSRTAKNKEITDRPCYHGHILAPDIKVNVAALQLSHDLIEHIEHVPIILEIANYCISGEFYQRIGCAKDSIMVSSNLIVFKFIPEDIEDENNYEFFYQDLISKEKFACATLPCEIFGNIYILPLPKENEPPGFLPITSRLNLENAPREDNLLLGILLRKPPREDGEISEIEEPPHQNIASSPKTGLLSPLSSDGFSNSDSMSPNKPSTSNASSKQDRIAPTDSLIPSNCYESYIGRRLGKSPDALPFLTDPADEFRDKSPQKKSRGTSSLSFDKDLEEISSESEYESPTKRQDTRARKRSASETSHVKTKHSKHKNNLASLSTSGLSSTDQSITNNVQKTSPSEKIRPKKLIEITDSNPQSASITEKKDTVSKVINVNESPNSDPDADFFPRKANTAMTGTFYSDVGSFEFDYRVIKSTCTKVPEYLPNIVTVKGRARPSETETFVVGAMQKPSKKAIIFEITPRVDSSSTSAFSALENERLFNNYATHLYVRKRYGMLNYKPDTYRAYVFPYLKGKKPMKALVVCNIKPSMASSHQLYGLIIKKQLDPVEPNKIIKPEPRPRSQSVASSTHSSAQLESPCSPSSLSVQVTTSSGSHDHGLQRKISEFESSDLHEALENVENKNYPGLEIIKIVEVIYSSVDDPCKLSATFTSMIHKATEGKPTEVKIEVIEDFLRKVEAIMTMDKKHYTKRQLAYKSSIKTAKNLHDLLTNNNS